MILAIESSTTDASVCLIEEGRTTTDHYPSDQRAGSGDQLLPRIDRLLAHGGWDRLRDVVVGEGPGGFTSLRIAAALAKGICVGRGVRLHAVSSLGLIVASAELPAQRRYLAVLDALRGELYAASVEVSTGGSLTRIGQVQRLPRGDVVDMAHRTGASLVGPVPEAEFYWKPSALGVQALWGTPHVRHVDIATWEPLYGRHAEAQAKWEAMSGKPLTEELTR